MRRKNLAQFTPGAAFKRWQDVERVVVGDESMEGNPRRSRRRVVIDGVDRDGPADVADQIVVGRVEDRGRIALCADQHVRAKRDAELSEGNRSASPFGWM